METDLTGPRVVRINPSNPLVAVDVSFEIFFSEPIAEARVTKETDHVVLVERMEVTDTFLSDISNPPLIDSRRELLIEIDLDWNPDSTVLSATPVTSLRPATGYSLVMSSDVRDKVGNPLVDGDSQRSNVIFSFDTDAGPPQVLSVSADGTVPANLRRIEVQFNQAVKGVSRSTLDVEAVGGGEEPIVESIAVAPDRSSAVILLDELGAGCPRFTPGEEYRVQIAEGISDDAGRVMPAQSFSFMAGGACELTPLVMTQVSTSAYDGQAIVRFSTNKASTTELRFGLANAQNTVLDCLGQPCPVLGPEARSVVDGAYLHEVQAVELALDSTYAFTVYAEDDYGIRAESSGSFQVIELPDVSLNEVLPNPAGEEAAGEFVELANFSETEIIDLTGWAIQIADKTPCVFGDDVPVLNPGDFLVIARQAFDASAFPGLNEAQVYRGDAASSCTATALTLSNEVQAVALLDDAGRPVSVYPGSPDLNPTSSHEGDSIDRVSPEAADVAASFCFPDGPPSPGATNSAVVFGCEGG